jgi:hypothetical protein
MLWTYEDKDISIKVNSDDIKYDAEYMNIFIEQLSDDFSWYKDRARELENGYVKYHNNETFGGKMAETTKRFIYEVQGDKLHMRNLEIKKDFLYTCFKIENKFKEEVDPSPKARVSTSVLLRIKKDFGTYYAVIDTKGYEIECHAKRLVDKYGRWGISTIPYYRRAMIAYEEFCGSGEFLDKCIKKLENFDHESCGTLDRKDFFYGADALQAKISNTAGVLDSMTVYQPNMAKNSIGLVGLSAATNAGVQNFNWDSFASKWFMQRINNKVPYNSNKIDIKDFLESKGISVNKLETDDGYFLIDKSVSDILAEAGVDPKEMEYLGPNGFDDWYITGLVKDDGSIAYSLIKVREPMDEQGQKATAIVFNSMNMTAFEQVISDSTSGKKVLKSTADQALRDINYIVKPTDHYNDYDPDILAYFQNPESDGSYLIADFAIDKVAHDEAFKDGVYELPFTYEEFDDYGGKDTLDMLAIAGIYDKDANTITIKDPDNLTANEQSALLLITTANRNKYSFAAENQYHADMYDNTPSPYIKKKGIKSDAGVGESVQINIPIKGVTVPTYERFFKPSNSKYYKEQFEAHRKE